MSNYTKAPAEGDRIDLGGKLPQFDAFAHLVYQEMVRGNLAWVRIADVNAEKLDDIQYATHTEIHAYQMKWSNQEKPPPFTYRVFLELLPEMISGWKALKVLHAGEQKKVRVHLVSNRPPSVNDEVCDVYGRVSGTFKDFLDQLFRPLKTGKRIVYRWAKVLLGIRKDSGLSAAEFAEFIAAFHIDMAFAIATVGKIKPEDRQKETDFYQLSRFIIEEVASNKKTIHFDVEQLIQQLGWESRFKTTFQHEFVVDKQRYQPITATLEQLDQQVSHLESGYVFLNGNPGSGKSTLLTQWAKNSPQRVIRYYAFSNISQAQNYSERGESKNLFFDLVIQLNQDGVVSRKTVLPYHDDVFLRSLFFSQLAELSADYGKNGRKTMIIIDGLDHIPREYHTVNSLLGNLPAPDALPAGILIILGSQTFELAGLQPDVRVQWTKGKNNLQMAFLDKKSVSLYIDHYDKTLVLTPDQKEKTFELSKGHPLQLTYLLAELNANFAEADQLLARQDFYYEDIENYYQKIWESIDAGSDLKQFLGLFGRVKGEINLEFVREWGFDEKVHREFRKKTIHLFSNRNNRLVFFHNSFRQFIIKQTAFDELTGLHDPAKEDRFHAKLADYYQRSRQEPPWNRNYHLYKSRQYDLFISEATGEQFTQQLLDYRPAEKIRQDMQLGIRIANFQKNDIILARYLFLLTELHSRIQNFDPAGFVEEHLQLGRIDVVRNYLRDDHILNTSKRFALSSCQDIYFFGDKAEAKLIFSLAEPEEIHENEIVVEPDTNYEHTVSDLEEWASAAVLFGDASAIITLIGTVRFSGDARYLPRHDSVEKLKFRLWFYAAVTLAKTESWQLFDQITAKYDAADDYQAHMLVSLLVFAAENGPAQTYLPVLLAKFDPVVTADENKVLIADAIFRLSGDLKQVKAWINGVSQPKIRNNDLSENYTLKSFAYRIKLNKLLQLTGQGQDIFTAVPAAQSSMDQALVEFERMLCLIAELLADGIRHKKDARVLQRIKPITGFYYRPLASSDSHKYTIKRLRKEYFDFLINAIAAHGTLMLNQAKDYFLAEFEAQPGHWPPDRKSEVLFSLIHFGMEKDLLIPNIEACETEVLAGHDSAGRIEQCQDQLKGWLDLADYERAERWMKQAIREALSIGYRKDYQLNTWMDWLEKANAKEPGLARERIDLYLSRLAYVKDVTEHQPFWRAAQKILRVTYNWNYGAGTRAQQYLVQKGLVHFEDSLEEFVRGTLNQVGNDELLTVIDLYNELLLSNADESRTTLLEDFLKRLAATGMPELIAEGLRRLCATIQIGVFDVYRPAYFAVIMNFPGLKEFDFRTLDLPDPLDLPEPDHSSNRLTLAADHQTLSEKEVLEKVTDFESFEKLLLLEDKINSSFDWHLVFDKLEPVLTSENIRQLTVIVDKHRKESRFYAELSDAALLLQDKALAVKLANKAIESSSSSGWDKYYDGGSRLNGFRALAAADPQTGYGLAFDTFCNDILATDYTSTYAEGLSDILPVISKQTSASALYPEVASHAAGMLSNAAADPLSFESLAPDTRSFREPMLDFLVFLCHFPATPIRKSALQYLATHLGFFPEASLKRLAFAAEKDQELLAELLLLNRDDETLIGDFRQELLHLGRSKNFSVENYALSLLIGLDEDFEPEPNPQTELSPLYHMHLGQMASIRQPGPLKPEDFVEETEDVRVITRALDFWVNYLADHTPFEKLNIQHRIYAVMKEIADAEEWSAGREKAIREQLESLDIKTSFTRPRVDIVRRAVLHVMKELNDGGYGFDPDHLTMLEFKDPETLLIPKHKMPTHIHAIKVKHEMNKEWVTKLPEHYRLREALVSNGTGWTVIGEYYQLKKLEWGFPTETYQSQLKFKKAVNDEEGEYIFGALFQRLLIHSPDPDGWPEAGQVIAINENRFFSRDLRSSWIAFNAKLAFRLGWLPHATVPLSWVDSSGNLMVESVYWENGNMHLVSRVSEANAGEGWFVNLSDAGMSALKKSRYELIYEKKIERSYDQDGDTNHEAITNLLTITK